MHNQSGAKWTQVHAAVYGENKNFLRDCYDMYYNVIHVHLRTFNLRGKRYTAINSIKMNFKPQELGSKCTTRYTLSKNFDAWLSHKNGYVITEK